MIAHGRVQGVFYRDTIRRAAIERGIAGSAVNLPVGTVECHFEGDRTAVEAMIEIARRGSPASLVSELDVQWIAPVGASDFVIG